MLEHVMVGLLILLVVVAVIWVLSRGFGKGCGCCQTCDDDTSPDQGSCCATPDSGTDSRDGPDDPEKKVAGGPGQ